MSVALPAGWFSSDLPGRACDRTYCLYSLESLPPLPHGDLDGRFDWLPDPGRHLDWAVGASEPGRKFDPASLAALTTEAASVGLTVPAPFETFLASARTNWIRSATGCWLELPERLVNVPGSSAYAIRFLNDQQGVVFWYLALGPEGDEGVVASNDLFDADEAWLEDPNEAESYVCAPSFEAFLYRYWIENEIYFRTTDGAPLTPVQRTYLDFYRSPS